MTAPPQPPVPRWEHNVACPDEWSGCLLNDQVCFIACRYLNLADAFPSGQESSINNGAGNNPPAGIKRW